MYTILVSSTNNRYHMTHMVCPYDMAHMICPYDMAHMIWPYDKDNMLYQYENIIPTPSQ